MSAPETTRDGTVIRLDGRSRLLVAHRQRLRVAAGPDCGLEVEVGAPRVRIGTARSNDVVLTDPGVSRHHCEIAVEGERYALRDLGSTNGTFVQGVCIVEAFLPAGALFQVGGTEIELTPTRRWTRVEPSESDSFGELYGSSAVMRDLFGLLGRVAPTDLSVLVTGESGTGKELTARAMHAASGRSGGPFVLVDCAALARALVDDELFGHEQGAFTGASAARPGPFELAAGGTVFLDEVGELPPEAQPKLLRLLERREVKRLGASAYVDVDVRILAATHRDLFAMTEEGRFREDLLHRLSEVVVRLPPLRERPEDVAGLARRILSAEGASRGLSDASLADLSARPWPGNVRELRNVLRRAAALAEHEVLRPADLVGPPAATTAATPDLFPVDVADGLPLEVARARWNDQIEIEYLRRVLRRADGDTAVAAAALGIHRKSVERLLRHHGLTSTDLKHEP